MPNRDRAAIDIVNLIVNAELVAAVERLAGEGFVELPQVNVVHFEPLALQQAGHGEHGADAHFVRLAARDRKALEAPQRGEIALFGFLGFHHNHSRRPIRQLGGVAGGDEMLLAAHRLEPAQTFQRGVGAVAVIAFHDHILNFLLAGFLVDLFHFGLHRHNLVLEEVGLLGGRHAHLALQRILVLARARNIIALGDNVGGLNHRHPQSGIGLHQFLFGNLVEIDALQLHQRNRLHPRADHHRHIFVHHPIGGHRNRLQTR